MASKKNAVTKNGSKSKLNTFQMEKLCLNDIENKVMIELDSYWQPFERQNDFGIDGIIFLGKKGHQTGQIVYVQAKYGDSYVFEECESCVTLKFEEKTLERWRNYWNSKTDPVILIYQNSSGQMLWVDAKDPKAFEKRRVKLPQSQKFCAKTKSFLIRMCGSKQKGLSLPQLVCKTNDRPNLGQRGDLKERSRRLYGSLKCSNAIKFKNGYFSDLKFTRLGWNHIVSPSRGCARITHSLELLGIAKLILENVKQFNVLKCIKEGESMIDHLGLRAEIQFKERAKGVVQIVILRRRDFKLNGNYDERKWFLSIHEIVKK